MKRGVITAPERIAAEHNVAEFDSGEATLDERLRKRAMKNTGSGASCCFVTCKGKTVVGYYSLCSSAVADQTALKAMRHNMPDP